MTFPQCVKWLVLEFDPQCGTAQAEDSLQLFIPAYRKIGSTVKPADVPDTEQVGSDVPLWPVLKKYHGTNNWPSTALILPGMVEGMKCSCLLSQSGVTETKFNCCFFCHKHRK